MYSVLEMETMMYFTVLVFYECYTFGPRAWA